MLYSFRTIEEDQLIFFHFQSQSAFLLPSNLVQIKFLAMPFAPILLTLPLKHLTVKQKNRVVTGTQPENHPVKHPSVHTRKTGK
ncbi:hypothetical protein AM500_05050 [Bacillus sp. FJAT-18017]|nr:hypothetical protein AM500_05050 [Bacillus sp. FJAT-18017]